MREKHRRSAASAVLFSFAMKMKMQRIPIMKGFFHKKGRRDKKFYAYLVKVSNREMI